VREPQLGAIHFRFWGVGVKSRIARWYIFKPKTKNANSGKFFRVLQRKTLVYFWPFGIFGHLVFLVIWYFWLFGIFPVLVLCIKKNLATLARSAFYG
jgi:hypothetical protein